VAGGTLPLLGVTAPGDVSLLRRRVRWLSCSTFGLAAFVVSRAGLLLPFVEKTLWDLGVDLSTAISHHLCNRCGDAKPDDSLLRLPLIALGGLLLCTFVPLVFFGVVCMAETVVKLPLKSGSEEP